MAKTRKHSRTSRGSKSMKMLKNTSKSAARGLKKVGSVTKNVISSSAPIVEKGVSKVYGTLATGFDLGVKGAKSVASGVSKMTKSKRTNRKSRRH
jgi:hypothetical protein